MRVSQGSGQGGTSAPEPAAEPAQANRSPEPAAEVGGAGGSAEPATAGGRSGSSRWLRGPLVLMAASLVLALAGTGLVIAAAQASGSPAAVNRAVIDQAATSQVLAAVSADVSAIFSYSYTDMGVTQHAEQRALAGHAAAQYRELFPLLQRNVASQQLTVVSKVVQAGVSFLSANTAQVLVFIDQTATRGHNKGSSTRAQLAITAQLRGGRWLITGIEAR